MRYVDIYLDDEPEYTMSGDTKIYTDCYAVVECSDENKKTYWHVLLTWEQYQQRLDEEKECITFSLADDKKKKIKDEIEIPLHTFCRHICDPLVGEEEEKKGK